MAHSNSTGAGWNAPFPSSESATIQGRPLTQTSLTEYSQSEIYPSSSFAFQVADTPCPFSEPYTCQIQQCIHTDEHILRNSVHRSPTLDLPCDVLSLPTIPDFHSLPDIPPLADNRAIILGNRILDTGIHASPSAGLQLLAADRVIEQLQSQIASTSGIVQPDRTRCYECSFAHAKKCLGHPDQPCHRCLRLFLAAFAMKASRPGINFVIFSNICTIRKRVASLRDDVSFLVRVQNKIALEEIPDKNIVISVDSGSPLPNTSTSRISVIIKHLATTNQHIQSSNVFAPALNSHHLDRFTDVEALISSLEKLTTDEKILITSALRCCNYLGVLFNWDANTISFQRGHQNRTSMSQAKNLVLEIMYSISHRIRELLKRLWDEIRVYPVGISPWHDPATVSCVLWILYSSLASFRQLKWEDKKLKFLDEFLTMLHIEAKEAMTSLEHYRRIMAFGRCGTTSQYQKAFKDLINMQKNRKPTFCFTYEGHETGFRLIQAPDHLSTYTYTDILLAPIPEDGGHSYEPERSMRLDSALTKPFVATTLTRKRKPNPASPSNCTPSHPEFNSHTPASAAFSQQAFTDLASLSTASEQETIPNWTDLSEIFSI